MSTQSKQAKDDNVTDPTIRNGAQLHINNVYGSTIHTGSGDININSEGTSATHKIFAECDKDSDILEKQRKTMLIESRVESDTRTSNGTSSKYNVQITGNVQGFVQGDNSEVTMNFNKNNKHV